MLPFDVEGGQRYQRGRPVTRIMATTSDTNSKESCRGNGATRPLAMEIDLEAYSMQESMQRRRLI